MADEQEPKYHFQGGMVFNRASGLPIPRDEPVFVFRARDVHAREVLGRYIERLGADPRVSSGHIRAVHERLEDFERFARECPDRMKTPDTEPAQ